MVLNLATSWARGATNSRINLTIIQVANLLQVEAVERAAVDFLVERLDAGNVLSAMALGAAVVSIIQAANLLQVEAVERAAVDFLVERLDAGNVLSAMALGAHLSAGAIGRELRDKSKAWAMLHSEEVLAEPSFLELPAEGVAVLVESDDLSAPEDSVFGAVMAWVKKDEAGRKPELARLLPLIRFPQLKASPAEPLFMVRSAPHLRRPPHSAWLSPS